MAFKISNELKVGVLVAATIVIFILGFNFLRGRGVFSSDKEYISYYDDVEGLQESAAVQLQGYTVGKVSEIHLQKDRKIKVVLLLKKAIEVPQGTIAQIVSNDLISGTKIISLNFGQSPEHIPEGGVIEGKESSGILDNLGSQVSPLVGVVQHTIVSLDTLLNSVNSIVNEQSRTHLAHSMAALETGMVQLSQLATQLNAQSGNLAQVLQNANSITSNLANSNQQIVRTLDNLQAFSSTLKDAPVQQTMADLQKSAAALQAIVGKVNTNEGSLGLLLNDRKLYDNLSQTLGTLDALLSDVQAHPAKYINISVFGSKARQ